MLRTVAATRYITPLREGGSLPALVEADDGELYVTKFCGAGQGVKALVAELIAGEIGRTHPRPPTTSAMTAAWRGRRPQRWATSSSCCPTDSESSIAANWLPERPVWDWRRRSSGVA